jgi:hypothetical protein
VRAALRGAVRVESNSREEGRGTPSQRTVLPTHKAEQRLGSTLCGTGRLPWAARLLATETQVAKPWLCAAFLCHATKPRAPHPMPCRPGRASSATRPCGCPSARGASPRGCGWRRTLPPPPRPRALPEPYWFLHAPRESSCVAWRSACKVCTATRLLCMPYCRRRPCSGSRDLTAQLPLPGRCLPNWPPGCLPLCSSTCRHAAGGAHLGAAALGSSTGRLLAAGDLAPPGGGAHPRWCPVRFGHARLPGRPAQGELGLT